MRYKERIIHNKLKDFAEFLEKNCNPLTITKPLGHFQLIGLIVAYPQKLKDLELIVMFYAASFACMSLSQHIFLNFLKGPYTKG